MSETAGPTKRFFLLSDAGKPVFAYASSPSRPRSTSLSLSSDRHSDDISLDADDEADGDMPSTFASLVQATVSNFTTQAEQLLSFQSRSHRFVLLQRPPLLLLACSRGSESEAQLRLQLAHIHAYVFFLLTHAQITALFTRAPNLDLRRLLQSSATSQMTHLCRLLDSEYRYFANCLEVVPMDPTLRARLGQAMVQTINAIGASTNARASLLYAMLVAPGKLLTLIRPKRHSLHPSDLHHLFTLLSSPSAQQFHETDSWIPLCLPKFNDRGFLHAYISFSVAPGVGLILVSCDRESLSLMCQLKEHMVESMLKQGLVLALNDTLNNQPYTPANIHPDLACVHHFLYKARPHVQFTHAMRISAGKTINQSNKDETSHHVHDDWVFSDGKSRILESYEIVQTALHDKMTPLQLIWRETAYAKILGWVSSSYELYVCFDGDTSKVDGVRSANRIVKWVRQHESTLFILNSPTF